mmetsp:Transcript_9151/g.11994  ORF Transcript_9151/g.11994 Transcript_9151/m.11994 type:complete len:498 (+) Transcript_9151:74-1567(+)
MFQFNSLKDKLQEGVGGAFSLDHLQDGDDWMEGEEEENQNGEDDSMKSDNLQDDNSLQFETEISEEQIPTDSSQPSETEVEDVEEKKDKPDVMKVLSAAKAASNFFSLDTMQEDDPWMGAGTQGHQQMNNANHSEPFDPLPIGAMGLDQDSDQSDEDELSTPSPLPSLSSAAAAAAATSSSSGFQSILDVAPLSKDDHQDRPSILLELLAKEDQNEKKESELKDINEAQTNNKDLSDTSDMNQTKVPSSEEVSPSAPPLPEVEQVWLPKYDRVVSVMDKTSQEDDAQWKPPPPRPVINPFEGTYNKDDIDNLNLAQTPSHNPYLSGLRLSNERRPTSQYGAPLKTHNDIEAVDTEAMEGEGKHSWFRRTADRDSLRILGDSWKASLLSGMGLQDDSTANLNGEFMDSTYSPNLRSDAHAFWPGPMSSAVRATRAKIDHFGLLIEKERDSVSPYFLDLISGRVKIRLTTVHKFQIAVIFAGMCLAYFYYTLSSYFVLT